MKTVLSWVSFALGIVLIVCGWFLWGDSSNTGIFTQNIVVSVIVYVVLSIDLLRSFTELTVASFTSVVALLIMLAASDNDEAQPIIALFIETRFPLIALPCDSIQVCMDCIGVNKSPIVAGFPKTQKTDVP